MALSLPLYRFRLQSDYSVADSIIDRMTNETLRVPIASTLSFEIGIFGALYGANPSAISQVPNPTTDGWTR